MTNTVTIPQADYEALVKDAERWRFVTGENYFGVCKYLDEPYETGWGYVDLEEVDKAMEQK